MKPVYPIPCRNGSITPLLKVYVLGDPLLFVLILDAWDTQAAVKHTKSNYYLDLQHS